jgi:hypothetical protein
MAPGVPPDVRPLPARGSGRTSAGIFTRRFVARAAPAATLAAILTVAPTSAGADWLVVPHTGFKFGGGTTLVDLESAAPERKTPFGLGVMWLGAGIVGAEADVTFIPDYFDREGADLVTGSSVRTVTGSLVVAAPLRLTRESLRPYVVGGVGLLHSESQDLFGLFSFKSDLWALNVGGGAIGFVSDGFGVRLDLRYYRNISAEGQPGIVIGDTRFSYWRLGLGLVFRP